MADQTPEYVPRPSGSSAGVVIGIVAVVILLLLVVCGVGLLGIGWFAYRAVEVQAVPAPPREVLEVAPAPAEPPAVEPPKAAPPGEVQPMPQ